MDIGIGLPNTVPGTEGRRLIDWAKNAEGAGFSTLGTIGRIVYQNYEELVALSAAAAVTSRIRLTTSVLLAPLYSNTALFAKQAASLDRLSGGRLVLGLGLGGRDDDFAASALPTTGKGRRLDQQLTEMKRIWSGERYGYAGAIGPEPVRRGGPELILGGSAEASFRRVALLGDGWIMGGGTPDMFAQGAARASRRPGRRRAARGSRASSRSPTSRSGPRPVTTRTTISCSTTTGSATSPGRSRRAPPSAPRWSGTTPPRSPRPAVTSSSSSRPPPRPTRSACSPPRSCKAGDEALGGKSLLYRLSRQGRICQATCHLPASRWRMIRPVQPRIPDDFGRPAVPAGTWTEPEGIALRVSAMSVESDTSDLLG